ncbi:SH3 domain-containing protein [Leptospira sp. WS4.C2]
MRHKLKTLKMKKIALHLILSFNLIYCFKEDNSQKPEEFETLKETKNLNYNYYTTVKTLNIRESSNQNSKVIGTISKCESVAILENEVNSLDENQNLVYIQTKNGLKGFTSYKFLKYKDKNNNSPIIIDPVYNKEPFNITRKWIFYADDPNLIIEFKNNLTGLLENTFEDYSDTKRKIEKIPFTYIYDGCCNIQVTFDSGKKIEISIIKLENKNSILMNCMYANPDYGKKY